MYSVLGNHKTMTHRYTVNVIHVYRGNIVFTQHTCMMWILYFRHSEGGGGHSEGGGGVVVVERRERSLQFLFSRVERRSSSCFCCFSSILNWHSTSIITGKLSRHMQLLIKSW